MSQLPRELQRIFGQNGGSSEFGKIGSKAAGSPATTKDLALIQSLTEYLQGLNAIVSDQGTSVLPFLEDMNSLFFLTTSQIAYLMQSGVPEWNDETEYYKDVSIVLENGQLWIDTFGSGGTPNLNFQPSTNQDKWKLAGALRISDFSTLNMIINVQTGDTVDLDADNIVFIDNFGGTKRVDNIDVTFDIANIMPGTSAKASTWYQLWLDSNLVAIPVPDLEGSADADVLNSLSDSGATFQTDLVQIDDEIFQLDDRIKGFVKAVSGEGLITCKDKDGNDLDLFPLGTESYKIRMLSPVGLGPIRARLGAAFRNSGGSFDDSTYTQIQEPKFYSESAGDFSITGSNWTTTVAETVVIQVNDWTGRGSWRGIFDFDGTLSIATVSINLTHGGITFFTGATQSVASNQDTSSSIGLSRSSAVPDTALVFLAFTNTVSILGASGNVKLNKKPNFHN